MLTDALADDQISQGFQYCRTIKADNACGVCFNYNTKFINF